MSLQEHFNSDITTLSSSDAFVVLRNTSHIPLGAMVMADRTVLSGM